MVKEKQKKVKLSKPLKVTIGIFLFLVVYVVSMFLPFIGGYTSWPYVIAKCGGLPVITNKFAAAWSYSVPGMTSYYGPTFLSSINNYVCTVEEASAQGYHKAPW